MILNVYKRLTIIYIVSVFKCILSIYFSYVFKYNREVFNIVSSIFDKFDSCRSSKSVFQLIQIIKTECQDSERLNDRLFHNTYVF